MRFKSLDGRARRSAPAPRRRRRAQAHYRPFGWMRWLGGVVGMGLLGVRHRAALSCVVFFCLIVWLGARGGERRLPARHFRIAPRCCVSVCCVVWLCARGVPCSVGLFFVFLVAVRVLLGAPARPLRRAPHLREARTPEVVLLGGGVRLGLCG